MDCVLYVDDICGIMYAVYDVWCGLCDDGCDFIYVILCRRYCACGGVLVLPIYSIIYSIVYVVFPPTKYMMIQICVCNVV